MFGMNIEDSLMFQNFVKNDSQQRFEYTLLSGDPIEEIAVRLDIYLNNGYIIYDLLNDEAKNWIDTVLDTILD